MGAGNLQRVVGLADLCELLTAAFAFPTEALVVALADGSFLGDAVNALEDAGACDESTAAVGERLAVFLNDGDVGNALRKGSSLLYFAPGAQVPVFPYESAFRHQATGARGVPVLFRSPITLDVERQMREAGVIPTDVHTEPADSVWNEFMLLSYLFGKQAEAIENGDEEGEACWGIAVIRFWNEHGSLWLPAFMEKTAEEASAFDEPAWAAPYTAFAELGSMVCCQLDEFARGTQETPSLG